MIINIVCVENYIKYRTFKFREHKIKILKIRNFLTGDEERRWLLN